MSNTTKSNNNQYMVTKLGKFETPNTEHKKQLNKLTDNFIGVVLWVDIDLW